VGTVRPVDFGVRDMAAGYAGSGNPYWAVNFYWTSYDPDVLQNFDGSRRAERLMEVSSTLPLLVVAAGYHSSRHNLPETIVSAWIECEELLADLRDKHVSYVARVDRRRRLRDFRTYTASVQADVLLTAGLIDGEAYAIVQNARRTKNNLAHGSVADQEGSSVTMQAMRSMLSRYGLSTDRLPGFSFMSGGSGRPRVALEPEFAFE
jgi:hypothetical protein